ncbi:hypothetical protein LV779_34745 [Streptomyces thinghirensis]|nr:hypothetical protein [Streptomyces thinghirensis]
MMAATGSAWVRRFYPAPGQRDRVDLLPARGAARRRTTSRSRPRSPLRLDGRSLAVRYCPGRQDRLRRTVHRGHLDPRGPTHRRARAAPGPTDR